jgi:hypothetical protein
MIITLPAALLPFTEQQENTYLFDILLPSGNNTAVAVFPNGTETTESLTLPV